MVVPLLQTINRSINSSLGGNWCVNLYKYLSSDPRCSRGWKYSLKVEFLLFWKISQLETGWVAATERHHCALRKCFIETVAVNDASAQPLFLALRVLSCIEQETCGQRKSCGFPTLIWTHYNTCSSSWFLLSLKCHWDVYSVCVCVRKINDDTELSCCSTSYRFNIRSTTVEKQRQRLPDKKKSRKSNSIQQAL